MIEEEMESRRNEQLKRDIQDIKDRLERSIKSSRSKQIDQDLTIAYNKFNEIVRIVIDPIIEE